MALKADGKQGVFLFCVVGGQASRCGIVPSQGSKWVNGDRHKARSEGVKESECTHQHEDPAGQRDRAKDAGQGLMQLQLHL